MTGQDRTYRNRVDPGGLVSFRVRVQETDLMVHAERLLAAETRDRVLRHRGYLEAFIRAHPEFARTLAPWPDTGPAPELVRNMIEAGRRAGVGPMAAVAGAIAEAVGRDLSDMSRAVVVENGGDVFVRTPEPVTVGIYAGTSPLSYRVGFKIGGGLAPTAVCTSSGTVGHSLSMGRADAVCLVSHSCALADAAATAIGNRIAAVDDIQQVIEAARTVDGLTGGVIIVGEALGCWGNVELVSLASLAPPVPVKKG